MTDTTQPPAETLAENDADMSWIDIAVIRNGAVICDAAPGWLPFLNGDIHVEDVFASTVEYPAAPGLYRWTGYTVGSWEEGDGCVAIGGTFAALTRRAGGDAIPAGWQLVPVQPAAEMTKAGEAARDRQGPSYVEDIWSAMLAATPKPPAGGDAGAVERLARIRTSMALLQQNSEGCALNHYGDDAEAHGLPGWLADTRADLDAFADILAALALPAPVVEGATDAD